jgi:hypothetical protein
MQRFGLILLAAVLAGGVSPTLAIEAVGPATPDTYREPSLQDLSEDWGHPGQLQGADPFHAVVYEPQETASTQVPIFKTPNTYDTIAEHPDKVVIAGVESLRGGTFRKIQPIDDADRAYMAWLESYVRLCKSFLTLTDKLRGALKTNRAGARAQTPALEPANQETSSLALVPFYFLRTISYDGAQGHAAITSDYAELRAAYRNYTEAYAALTPHLSTLTERYGTSVIASMTAVAPETFFKSTLQSYYGTRPVGSSDKADWLTALKPGEAFVFPSVDKQREDFVDGKLIGYTRMIALSTIRYDGNGVFTETIERHQADGQGTPVREIRTIRFVKTDKGTLQIQSPVVRLP